VLSRPRLARFGRLTRDAPDELGGTT
jgi:hypothetical protein